MPLYEYECRGCGQVFERRLAMSERESPQSCPSCGAGRALLRVSRPALVGGGSAGSVPVCPGSGQPCRCGHGPAH